MKALLFLNGEPPATFPAAEDYAVIACTDGAFTYLKEKNFPLEKLNFISGDFDSHTEDTASLYAEKFIPTPDQNYTDFHKALSIIEERYPNIRSIHILGASGRQMDHFLGNLTTAFSFRKKFQIIFEDESMYYYFVPKESKVQVAVGNIVSLYPFPAAENIVTEGLQWALNNEKLDCTHRVGTRNIAIKNTVTIQYGNGALLLFLEKKNTPLPFTKNYHFI